MKKSGFVLNKFQTNVVYNDKGASLSEYTYSKLPVRNKTKCRYSLLLLSKKRNGAVGDGYYS